MRGSLIRKQVIKTKEIQVCVLVYSSAKHFKVLCIILLRISLAILKPLCLLCRTLISNLEPLMFVSDCNRTIPQPEISPTNSYPRRAPVCLSPNKQINTTKDFCQIRHFTDQLYSLTFFLSLVLSKRKRNQKNPENLCKICRKMLLSKSATFLKK